MLQIGVRLLHGLRTKRNPSTNQRARSRMVCLSSSVLNLKRKRLSPISFTETPLVVFQALDRIARILFLLMVLRAIKRPARPRDDSSLAASGFAGRERDEFE